MDYLDNCYVTDGHDLVDKASELKEAGVTDVIVEVNTFNFIKYRESNNGKRLQPVIEGINAAITNQLNVRLNVSLKEGFNDDEILDFLQLTFQHKYDIVFLPTISYDIIKSKMPGLVKVPGDFPGVDMYKYPGSIGRIGFAVN